ncbi:MAG: hypothetical protein AAF224_09315 [Pseudomonadota bacterium]
MGIFLNRFWRCFIALAAMALIAACVSPTMQQSSAQQNIVTAHAGARVTPSQTQPQQAVTSAAIQQTAGCAATPTLQRASINGAANKSQMLNELLEGEALEEVQGAPAPFRLARLCKKQEAALAEANETIKRLEAAADVYQESFSLITLAWIKAALYYGGDYEGLPIKGSVLNTVVRSAAYDKHTVSAVKRFQCRYHRQPERCEDIRASGWITFPEARDLLCRAGYALADPDLTLLVAEWYTDGKVFEKNLPFADVLAQRLIEDTGARLRTETNDDEARRLLQFQQRAVLLQKVMTRDVDFTPGDPDLVTVETVCPRNL